MSRKQKKKDAREQSTRQLMGIDDITDYGIATRMGELVFFAIKPTNISVLPDAGVGARIYALLNVVKGMAEIEMLALNSKESFENNKAFYRQRANEEGLPVIRKLLEQDSKHLDRIQVLMASSREFYILVRLQGKKESDVFSYLSRIRLNNLIPSLLEQVDSGTLKFVPAAESISYLTEKEQIYLAMVMERDEVSPSMDQAKRLKQLSAEGKLAENIIDLIMREEKPLERKVTLRNDKLERFFPKSYTPKQMEDVILKLLEGWQRKRQQEQTR